MFNAIRKYILILGIFLLASTFTIKANAAESDVHNQEEIIYLAPELDLSIATEEEIKILEDIGWNLEAEIPYLIVEKEIETNDKHLETNQAEEPSVIDLGELFDQMNESEINPETSEELTFMPYHNMSYKPIYSPPAHGTKVYKTGDKVHCNRFNGPKSDNKHYSKTKPKALINFNGSDCDIAVRKGYCKLLNDNCNTSSTYHRGWCSEKIAHNINYHKH